MTNLKKYLCKVYKKTLNLLLYPVRRRALDKLFIQGIPEELYVPFLFLLTKRFPDEETKNISIRVETIRKELGKKTGCVSIFYSPNPAEVQDIDFECLRPKHGEEKIFTMKQVADTGKDWYWGTFLYLCAKSFKSKILLELGSCVGISACYLA